MLIVLTWVEVSGDFWTADGPDFWAIVDWDDAAGFWRWEVHVTEELHDEDLAATLADAQSAAAAAVNRAPRPAPICHVR